MRGPWAITAAIGAAAMLGACASSGDKGEKQPGRIGEVQRGVAGAATAPLKDVGLIKPQVNKMLSELDYPYDTAIFASGCTRVAYEIGALDALLGPENYAPSAKQKRKLTQKGADAAGDAAVDAVVGAAEDTTNFIPFRSWVRKASGAAKAERNAARAYELGHTRRAFLRGYGAAIGCGFELPPGPVDETAPVDAAPAPPS